MIAYTDTFIENSQGVRAFIGDKIYLQLSLLSWIPEDKPYKITDLQSDGTIVFDDRLYLGIRGIIDFETATKRPKAVVNLEVMSK